MYGKFEGWREKKKQNFSIVVLFFVFLPNTTQMWQVVRESVTIRVAFNSKFSSMLNNVTHLICVYCTSITFPLVVYCKLLVCDTLNRFEKCSLPKHSHHNDIYLMLFSHTRLCVVVKEIIK